MKTRFSPSLRLLAPLILVSPWLGALPDEAQVVQAESMTLVGDGWTVGAFPFCASRNPAFFGLCRDSCFAFKP
jgi:hypothetical protein